MNAGSHRVQQLREVANFGSHAALRKVVVPSARVAAIIKFSVPVTVTLSNLMSAPFSRVASASTYPCSIRTSAPNVRKPLMWRSIGRAPIAQPPGSELAPCEPGQQGTENQDGSPHCFHQFIWRFTGVHRTGPDPADAVIRSATSTPNVPRVCRLSKCR